MMISLMMTGRAMQQTPRNKEKQEEQFKWAKKQE